MAEQILEFLLLSDLRNFRGFLWKGNGFLKDALEAQIPDSRSGKETKDAVCPPFLPLESR